jgi:hypothetical protein
MSFAGQQAPEPDEVGNEPWQTPGGVWVYGDWPERGVLLREDWNDQPGGVQLDGVQVKAEHLPTRYTALENLVAHPVLGPGSLRGWFRFDELQKPDEAVEPDRRLYIFDGGVEKGIDRVSLYLVGDSELVLSLKDEALDMQESGGEPRAATVRYLAPRPFREGNWYHIAAFWKGTDRGDLALCLDGRFVGEETLGSRLSADIDDYANAIPVEDGSRFADSGWIRIGQTRWLQERRASDRGIGDTGRDANGLCEVLHYSRRSGNTLYVDTAPVNALTTLEAAGVEGEIVVERSDPGESSRVRAEIPPADARRPSRGSGRMHTFSGRLPGGGIMSVSEVLGYPHDEGTLVVPYGYHSRVKNAGSEGDPYAETETRTHPPPADDGAAPAPLEKDVIRATSFALTYSLPEHMPATLLYEPVVPYNPLLDPLPELLSIGETTIPVLGLPGDWPPMGIVRITSRKGAEVSVERILYRRLGTNALEDCLRGIEGTDESAHFLFDSIVLESALVTDPSDFPERPTLEHGRVFASLTAGERTEWLSFQRTAEKGYELLGLLLLPTVDSLDDDGGQLPVFPYKLELLAQMFTRGGNLGGAPEQLEILLPLQPEDAGSYGEYLVRWETFSAARSTKGTDRLDHRAGQLCLPTFAVRTIDSNESGAGDVVTVTDDSAAKPAREEITIAHGAGARFPQDAVTGWLVAFRTKVSRDYAGAANARLARWPVGGLQSVPSVLHFGKRGIGEEGAGLRGAVDDLVTVQMGEDIHFFPLGIQHDQGLSLKSKQVDVGLYLGDGEVLAVVKKESKYKDHDLVTLVRGAMGSTARGHSRETPFWLLEWPLFHVVDKVRRGPDGPLALRQVPKLGAEPDELTHGYFAVDRGRSAPYAEVRSYAKIRDLALEPPRDVFGQPAFRGAFGSGRVELRENELLIELPFRVQDRYEPRVNSLQGVFLQVGRELGGSRLLGLDWSEHLPNPYCEVVVTARADGAPGWGADPEKHPLFVFTDPKAPNPLNRRADRVELRVALTFKPDAFYQDGWKQAAVVGALRVRYRQPTQSLRREERTE